MGGEERGGEREMDLGGGCVYVSSIYLSIW